MSGSKPFIKEQGTGSVPEYRWRVRRLAVFYAGIVLCGVTTIVLLLWHGRLFVTLAQRSNVETATIAVVILLFTYLTIACFRGAVGAVRIALLNLPTFFGATPRTVEERKQRALRWSKEKDGTVYLNALVRQTGCNDAPIAIRLEDEFGSLGTVTIDGAQLSHQKAPAHSSNSIFAYFERRIEMLVEVRQPQVRVSIVEWTAIDDESALRYAGLVHFGRKLEAHLGCQPLWPAVELTEADIEVLRAEARELCPTLRNEAFLPDLEYEV
ncbi:MAG: hypothetical protein JWN02_736, partial [Acidobacteria bacterium]|nr:hypothetical protein [Acidobacteriota bacterium]